MADLSKVKVGTTYYNLKDAAARESIAANASAIAAEVSRATGVESGLDTRITNLEARGRFLSNYDVATGLPTTYPEVPSGQSTYTYTFKSGDYYIVGNVPASGDKYMPDGSSISYDSSKDPKWTVGKKKTTDTISTGDQFVFDGTNWVHIAAAKDVAWGQIVGILSNQTDLQAALDAKADSDDLGALAYKASATGSTTLSTIDAITMKKATVAGNAAVTVSDASATLTKGDYTPAGSVTGTTTAAGTVSLRTFTQTSTAATIASEAYTPVGTISGTTTAAGSVAGTVIPTGTVSTTVATADASAVVAADDYTPEGTVAVTLSNGALTDLMDSVGTQASYSHSGFEGGSLAAASTDTFAKAGIVASVNTSASASDPDFECLVFSNATTASAVTAQGEFTPAVYGTDNFTANSLPTKKSQTVAVASATFTGTLAEDIKVTGVTYKKSGDATSTFVGNPTGDAINATFTGASAAINATFTGSEVADMKITGVTYDKATANGATFTGTEAAITASFAGTTAASILTTGVTYSKANASASFSVDITPEVSAITSSAKTIEITVE